MNGVYIMMPVKCIGKMCKNCPNLKVDSSVTEYTAAEELGWRTGHEVDLKCRGVDRCLRIAEMMEEANEKSSGQDP